LDFELSPFPFESFPFWSMVYWGPEIKSRALLMYEIDDLSVFNIY